MKSCSLLDILPQLACATVSVWPVSDLCSNKSNKLTRVTSCPFMPSSLANDASLVWLINLCCVFFSHCFRCFCCCNDVTPDLWVLTSPSLSGHGLLLPQNVLHVVDKPFLNKLWGLVMQTVSQTDTLIINNISCLSVFLFQSQTCLILQLKTSVATVK